MCVVSLVAPTTGWKGTDMNESFSATVTLNSLLAAVKIFERDGGVGDQPNLVVTVDDHGELTIGPEPVKAVSIQSIRKD